MFRSDAQKSDLSVNHTTPDTPIVNPRTLTIDGPEYRGNTGRDRLPMARPMQLSGDHLVRDPSRGS